MARISEFFGIVIYMYWFNTKLHKAPHLHPRYRGAEAVYSLSWERIAGDLGNRANKLIKEWCKENHKELQQAWQAAVTGKELPWITPLQ